MYVSGYEENDENYWPDVDADVTRPPAQRACTYGLRIPLPVGGYISEEDIPIPHSQYVGKETKKGKRNYALVDYEMDRNSHVWHNTHILSKYVHGKELSTTYVGINRSVWSMD
jgi:hypothetical protein